MARKLHCTECQSAKKSRNAHKKEFPRSEGTERRVYGTLDEMQGLGMILCKKCEASSYHKNNSKK